MQKIPGPEIAKKIIDDLKLKPQPKKILAAILVNSTNSPQVGSASKNFLKQKEKIAKELGIDFKIYEFKELISENELIREIKKIASDDSIGGIIVQLPLPQDLNRQNILNTVPQEKDVDVLSDDAKSGNLLPPAVGAVKEIADYLSLNLKSLTVAVIGLGFLVGQPISEWLKGKTQELHILRRGSDFKVLKDADLVITGVGKSRLIKLDMLKDQVVLIDFGYEIKDGKISGDFDSTNLNSNLLPLASYTPTPGGTGPILVAKLFENFYKLNRI